MQEQFTPSSGLGWVDFSEEDKGKVMKVIELLKAEGTVDELGVGVVRNSLSDIMFNGITTIQTRAKYFFIVPRILQTYLNLKRKPKNGLDYLYKEETRIMNELAQKYNYQPELGIIGYTVAQENQYRPERRWNQVERKPSTIYWNGLRTYEIFNRQYSLANFLKAVERKELNHDKLGFMNGDGEKGDDNDAELNSDFYFNLPSFHSDWDNDLQIVLEEEEANFLRHQIIDTQKGKLLAQILENEDWIKQFLDSKNFIDMTLKPFVNELPNNTREIIYTARDFWNIMYGAHIRYNVLLQEKHGSLDSKERHEKLWNDWWDKMENFDWARFDLKLMWEITDSHSKVKRLTRNFINEWMDGVEKRKSHDFLDTLVFNQEKFNKGGRAKLRMSNDENYKKWVGIGKMEFRFGNAKQIISDIAVGLKIVDARL